jgi:hypothetical protein
MFDSISRFNVSYPLHFKYEEVQFILFKNIFIEFIIKLFLKIFKNI